MAYSDLTIFELRDELRSRGLPVSGSKDELVARLAEAEEHSDVEVEVDAHQSEEDEVEVKVEEKVDGGRIMVRAGGFVAMADPPPPTPAPIEICSVCGRNPHECSHGEPSGWTVAPEE